MFIAYLFSTGAMLGPVLNHGNEGHRQKESKQTSTSCMVFCLYFNINARWMISALYIICTRTDTAACGAALQTTLLK